MNIEVCSFSAEEGKVFKHKIHDKIILPFLWDNFTDTCIKHFLHERCPKDSNCKKIYLWSYKNDCQGRLGRNVHIKASLALDLLAKEGIYPTNPDTNNPNWYYACKTIKHFYMNKPCNKTELFSSKECAEVFAYYLNLFHEMGKKYPNYFFISDADIFGTDLILPDNTIASYICDTHYIC